MERRWTTQMDEQLTTMWVSHASDDEISLAVGKPASAVRSRAARLTLGSRDMSVIGRPTADGKLYWTADEDRQLLEMKRRGVKARLIGEALGRPEGGVTSRLLKLEDRKATSDTWSLRKCMRCQSTFRSEGMGNRMCYPCKEYAVIARSQYD